MTPINGGAHRAGSRARIGANPYSIDPNLRDRPAPAADGRVRAVAARVVAMSGRIPAATRSR
ncbi:hypothetical protein, partial [Burkholderia thailandensis]